MPSIADSERQWRIFSEIYDIFDMDATMKQSQRPQGSNHQVRFSWARFVFPVVLAAIVLSTILLAQFRTISLNMLEQANSDVLDQSEYVQRYITDFIFSNGMQLFYDDEVTKLRTSDALTESQVILGQRKLDSFGGYSNAIHSVYAYNGTMQTFFASGNVPGGSVASFFDQGVLPLLSNATSFGRLQPVVRQVPDPYGGPDATVNTFVLYEQSVAGAVDNALVVNTRGDWLDDVLATFFGKIGVLVLNETGQVVGANFPLSAMQRQRLEALLATRTAASGRLVVEDSEGKDLFFYDDMGSSGWCFVRHMDWNELFGEFDRMRTITFVSLLGILLVVTIMALIHALRFFRPLRKVTDALYGSKLVDQDMSVEQGVGQLLDAKRSNDRYLGLEYIRSLLSADVIEMEDVRHAFRQYGIPLDADKPVQLLLLATTDEQVLKQLVPYNLVLVQGGGTLLFAQDTVDVATMSTSIGCRCAVGMPVPWNGPLRTSLMHLQECLSYGKIGLDGRLVVHEQELLSKLAVLDEKDDKQPDLLDAVARNNSTQALQILDDYLQLLCGYRFSVVVFNLKRLWLSLRDNEDQMLGNAALLDGCDVHEIFSQVVEEDISRSLAEKSERTEVLVQKVVQVIQDSYADKGLCSQSIADTLGRNSAYLGKLFRAKSGISISDAINACRVEHAQALLLSTDWPIEEIAAQCGFPNTKYFYTLFRKATRKSPAAWRKEVQS